LFRITGNDVSDGARYHVVSAPGMIAGMPEQSAGRAQQTGELREGVLDLHEMLGDVVHRDDIEGGTGWQIRGESGDEAGAGEGGFQEGGGPLGFDELAVERAGILEVVGVRIE